MFEIGTFIKCKRKSRWKYQEDKILIFKIVSTRLCQEASCIWGKTESGKKKICSKCDGIMYRGLNIRKPVKPKSFNLGKKKPYDFSLAGFDMIQISEAEVMVELL
jgi:hypothetical protein